MRRRREPLHDNGIDSIVLEMRFLKAVLNSEQTGSVVGKKDSIGAYRQSKPRADNVLTLTS